MIARQDHKAYAKRLMHRRKPSLIGANVLDALFTTGSIAVGSAAIGLAGVVGFVFVLVILMGAADFESLVSTIIDLLRNPVQIYLFVALLIASGVLVYGNIVKIVSGAFSGAADCGNKRYYMASLANDGTKTSMLITMDGFHDFTGTFCTYILLYLVLFVWMAPFLLAGFLFGLIDGTIGIALRILFYLLAALSWWVGSHFFWAVPYVKAEQPGRSATSCIKEGRRVSKGHEFDLMILSLTFLGWDILSSLSLGLVGLFYTAPYERLTYTLVYRELKGGRLAVEDRISTLPAAPAPAASPAGTGAGKGASAPGAGPSKAASAPQQTPRTPQPERTGGIVGVSGEYAGAVIDLKAGQSIIIGRDAARCNLILSNAPKVSGKHCEIRYLGAGEMSGGSGEIRYQVRSYELIDYSSNGTLADGRKLPKEVPVRLDAGALVCLADNEVSFRLR